ncbi:MAG: hypothetical protein GX939_07380 [Clostridiaceae bacterium]|jgi:hypothetical protein|nr:hypothetical protein [Clostridiaceae bacterium]
MKVVRKILKVVSAGLLSVVILSLLLCTYKLTPVHIENREGNTDYVWPPNSVWVNMDEGISWGKYDSKGFNNKEVIYNPDIIILGSSHMEAVNVFQNQTVSYLLGQKFGNKYTVYNMGISGHHFFKVCQYLPNTIELYEKTPKVIAIETNNVSIAQEDVNRVLDRTIDYTPSHSTGVIGALQKVPFFRRVYRQLESGLIDLFTSGQRDDTPDSNVDKNETRIIHSDVAEEAVDENAYTQLFQYLSNIEKNSGTQIIVFYHPAEKLNKDGSIEFKRSVSLSAFEKYSMLFGIDFIDMTETFEAMYYEEHLVPHGFITGEIGFGHLNVYGHAAIANSLYDKIIKLEKTEQICK